MSFAITMLGILGERPRNAKPFFRAGPGVRAGCGVLGLDPLYLANEGKLICVLPGEKAAAALAVMRDEPVGAEAALVGEIMAVEGASPRVTLRTRMGGQRLLSMLEGAQLPRIC